MDSKKILLVILSVSLFYNCKNNAKLNTETDKTNADSFVAKVDTREDFQSFLTKFQQDSIFQIERIEFPLTVSIYESGSYMDHSDNVIDLQSRNVIISKREWKYQNFSAFIKLFSEINENECKMELQIEDTGVSVNYIFRNNNNKWYLVKIVDESM